MRATFILCVLLSTWLVVDAQQKTDKVSPTQASDPNAGRTQYLDGKAENQPVTIGAKLATRTAKSPKTSVGPSKNVASEKTITKVTVVESPDVSKNAITDSTSDFMDPFFGDAFLDDITTTTAGPPQPPPSFDPRKKKERKKVLPKLGEPEKAHDGSACNLTYKPHPELKTKYMMRLPEGVWRPMNCSPVQDNGLVWRQDLCNCGEERKPHDPNDMCGLLGFKPNDTNKHVYHRVNFGNTLTMRCPSNLVWSQKSCHCIYDTTVVGRQAQPTATFVCKTILNMTFEQNLMNNAANYEVRSVELKRRGHLQRLRFVNKIPGSTGYAAEILSQPLEFLAFRGNDFQKQVTFTIDFKIHPRRSRSRNFMVLLSDGCMRDESGLKKIWPSSFNLTFQPRTNSFGLHFVTNRVTIDEMVPGVAPDKDGWYRTVVYFEDKTVNLEVNGRKLLTVENVVGKLNQNKCSLYIAGRGRGFSMREHFYGYMDNIFLVKDCRFHDAKIL